MKKMLMLLSTVLLILCAKVAFADFSHSVAFNPDDNRFLLVYVQYSPVGSTIYGRLTDGEGRIIGSDYAIVPAAIGVGNPSVAYDSLHRRFLVVFEKTERTRSGEEYKGESVFGQLVNADGSLFGTQFPIAAAIHNQIHPAVTNDSINHKFLVVWEDHRIEANVYDIYGQLVNDDGSLSGVDFPICYETYDQYLPSVTYDSLARRFLVTWSDQVRDYSLFHGIRAQMVGSNGALIGEKFTIGQTYYSLWSGADAAYDDAGRAFVVYTDAPVEYAEAVSSATGFNPTVSGQFISPSLVLDGGKIVFPDSTASVGNMDPDVAWDSITQRFIVAWAHRGWSHVSTDFFSYPSAVHYQFIRSNGMFEGGIASIPNAIHPKVVYNSVTRNIFLGYRVYCTSYGSFVDGEIKFGTLAALAAEPVSCPATETPPSASPICGNGSREAGEECDDGNISGGDGCSATCRIETPATPPPSVCGNRIVEAGEECDDGNTANGDGCSSTCRREAGAGTSPVIAPSIKKPIAPGAKVPILPRTPSATPPPPAKTK